MKALALAGFACLGAVLTAGCGSDDGGNDRPDTTPPRLLSTDPPDDVVGVALDHVITATFTEPIDIASIDSARFTLTAGGSPVPGTVSTSGRTVRFRPAAQLLPGTEHGAFISGLVTDRAGNPLGADFAWTFETERDEWRATGSVSAPEGRTRHTAVWTGSEMIIWGGITASQQLVNTGGRYEPVTDVWTQTPLGISAPSARRDHTAVWTGSEMIVWGGETDLGGPTNTGGRYQPGSPTWSATAFAPGSLVPLPRRHHTAVWTGTEMIVWGGRDAAQFLPTGARYRPADDTWTPVSATNAPLARIRHTAVWTGEEMIVWGGEIQGGQLTNTGARYNPVTNTWASLPDSGAPLSRRDHTAVWTGKEMIVWGGEIQGGQLTNTGARYNPVTNTWTPVSPSRAPAARTAHTAVWTGYEMIVWGGTDGVVGSTGARYQPISDSWRDTANAGAPEGRFDHTAVWTGQEMIVWGGVTGTGPTAAGGRYAP